eukprot:10509562-Alexandrium_andersonii.AAC.1
MVLCHHEGAHLAKDKELEVSLDEFKEVRLLVLAIPAKTFIVARQTALGNDDVWLKVSLILDPIRSDTMGVLREARLVHIKRRWGGTREPSPQVRSAAPGLVLAPAEQLGTLGIQGLAELLVAPGR